MFICRRCLLQAHAPKRPPVLLFARHFRPEALYIPQSGLKRKKSPHDSKNTTDSIAQKQLGPGGVSEAPKVQPEAEEPHMWSLPLSEEEKRERRRKYGHWRYEPVSSYFKQRNHNPDAIATTPFYAFRWFIKAAVERGRSDYLDYVTRDVVRRYVGRSRWERLWVLGKLLKSTRQGNQTLAKDKILMIVDTLHNEDSLRVMPPLVIGYAAKAVIKYPENVELDLALIKLLTPYLMEQAVNLKGAIVTRQTEGLLRHVVWPLYGFVQKLLALNEKDKALALFQELVERNLIPKKAFANIDSTSKDVTYIMVGTMINACVAYNWHLQARNMLLQALDTDEPITVHPLLVKHMHDSMRLALDRDCHSDFDAATIMLTRLLTNPQTPMIPDDILMRYYKRAKQRNAGAQAEKIYDLSTSSRATEKRVYPPPTGGALLWFLEYCVFTSKNFRIARNLADQVVNDDVPVPLHDKPLVVAAIASVGWAKHARELWDRYTHRQGAQLVFGNAQTMLRLVSLFNHLIRRGEALLENLKQGRLEPEDQADSSKLANFQMQAAQPELGTSSPPDKQKDGSARSGGKQTRDIDEGDSEDDLTDLTEDLPEAELADAEHHWHPKRPRPPPSQHYSPETRQEDIERWEGRLVDFRAFADHVIDKFAAMRMPLHKADHFDLNALARAYFIVGRVADGFKMFNLILNRREIPDLSDVNVALSAMAEQSPSQAAKMVEKMVSRGLKPDAVSFGTIIHSAIMDRDMPLVAKLIRRARELGVGELTYKTMGSLIRATVVTLYEDENAASEQLENAKDLVDSLQAAGYVPSTRMALDCIIAALRADDPIMAFRFWKLFLKDKSHWGDHQQANTRSRIAKQLRVHREKGWLRVDFANIMLSELGEDVSMHVDRRRREYRQQKRKLREEPVPRESLPHQDGQARDLGSDASARSSLRIEESTKESGPDDH